MSLTIVDRPSVSPTGLSLPLTTDEVTWNIKQAPTQGRGHLVVVRSDATPASTSIATLPHPSLRLRRPIAVTVEREDDAVGVWSDELEELGIGPHLSAAIEDFQRSVVELYFSLASSPDALGPDLARLWRLLQDLIVERS